MPRASTYRAKTAAAIFALIAFPTSAQQRPSGAWPDEFVSRVEILALIQTLNAGLLASRSATATLEKWCADHKMATEPRVIARRVIGAEKPASPETRQRLRVGADEAVKYRRVQLSCGDHILSEADNWYVPGRLPDEANRLLDATQTPFGKAVQGLQPFRRTIDVKILWSPLPDGWELDAGSNTENAPAGGAMVIPHGLFEHRAMLFTGDQTPISEVDETYTNEILDFPVKATGDR